MSQTDLAYSVEAALAAMELTTNFKKFVVDNRTLWSTFGRMDSHLYRAKLMKLMDKDGLTKEQRLVVHFLFSVVKKKSRVLEGLNGMSDTVKGMGFYDPVKSFIAGRITDYNTASKSPDKFPGTHIPITNPGLDMLMWKLQTPKAERTLDAFFARTTSIQLHLSTEAQEKSKSGYKYYWDNVVKGTRNTATTEEAKYREDYYNTSAGDKYPLVGDDLKPLAPSNAKTGYSLKEIEDYLKLGE